MLLLAILLTSCSDVSDTDIPDTTEAESEPAFVDISPYIVEETFMPKDVYEELSYLYSNDKKGFSSLPTVNMPYITSAVTDITDCTLKSISIPVFRTGAPDGDGYLTFTVFVYDSSFAGIKQEPKREYKIKIDPEKYGISALKGNIYKFIEVDLSSYSIILAKDETLGFCDKKDSVIPSFLDNSSTNQNAALKMLRSDFPRTTGFYYKSSSELVFSEATLLFNLKWDRSYESLSVYNEISSQSSNYEKMVNELKEKYKGKYLALIGDSISTFEGVCNNTSVNSTIGQNAVYYSGTNHNLFDVHQTYWGKLAKDLEMELGVINTWSGSFAYGAGEGKGNMLDRAVQLHMDKGTTKTSDDIAPDVILIYIGINDLNGGSPMGDLSVKLRKNNGVSDSEKVAEWFEKTVAQAKRVNGVVQGKTYTSYEQVYALSLQAIKEKYPDAEIFCMTLQESNHSGTTKQKLENYNMSIKAIAEYFGVTVIDQETDGITWDNCHAYGCDIRALHPNVVGHAEMTENIVKTMYENNK